MTTRLTDLAVIDLIGSATLQQHFAMTRQNVYKWRVGGIPKQYRNSVRMLGESLEIDLSGWDAEKAA